MGITPIKGNKHNAHGPHLRTGELKWEGQWFRCLSETWEGQMVKEHVVLLWILCGCVCVGQKSMLCVLIILYHIILFFF